MKRLATRAIGALFCLAAGTAQALSFDEGVNGDLSNDRMNPSALGFNTGINSLVMSTQAGDRDYFTFAVPVGYRLSSIFHHTYVSEDNRSFVGLQSGGVLTEDPTAANAGNLLGYTLFGVDTINTQIIDDLASSNLSSPAAMGFETPGIEPHLPAGNYTFWMQQTGDVATYSFDFVLTPVPEPGQWALMLGGGLLLAARLRKVRS